MTSNHTSIAVTGGNGLLATALRDYFPYADYLSRESCDVANYGSVKGWFGKHKYDLIIHAGAETRGYAPAPQFLHANIIGTVNMVQWAMQQNARFVYTSTDYVYKGTGSHTEDEGVFPRNGYSWSKLGGECAVQLHPNSLIVRGSWYGTLELREASTDGYTGKVPVAKAACQIAQLAVSSATGIVNVGGPRRSMFEIVVTEFNPRCQPMLRRDAQTHYSIPADTSLNLNRMATILG